MSPSGDSFRLDRRDSLSSGGGGNVNEPPAVFQSELNDGPAQPQLSYYGLQQQAPPPQQPPQQQQQLQLQQLQQQSFLPGSSSKLGKVNAAGQMTLSPEDGTWITIFGFPPSSSSLILQKFQTVGTIVQHLVGEGNYMHIRFSTKIEAQAALNLHGSIVGQRLLIGVVPTAKVSELELKKIFLKKKTNPINARPSSKCRRPPMGPGGSLHARVCSRPTAPMAAPSSSPRTRS